MNSLDEIRRDWNENLVNFVDGLNDRWGFSQP